MSKLEAQDYKSCAADYKSCAAEIVVFNGGIVVFDGRLFFSMGDAHRCCAMPFQGFGDYRWVLV